MKEYNIKLTNFRDFMEFRKMIKEYHLQGELVQRDLRENINAFLPILLSLPLDSATIYLENNSAQCASAIETHIKAFA